MPRDTIVNHDLMSYLSEQFNESVDIVDEIAQAFGCEAAGELSSGIDYPVLAFYMKQQDTFFQFFAATPDRFVIFERQNTGDYFSFTIPAASISQVVLTKRTETTRLDIEVNAGRMRGVIENRFAFATGEQAQNPPNTISEGNSNANFVLERNVYSLEVSNDEFDQAEHLKDLNRALRNILGT